jgi:ribokinase
MSLMIVGGTVVDVIFPRVPRLPQWPKHTEFTTGNLVRMKRAPIVTLGGNGGNSAYVAARSGARVTLHTQIGDDALGGLARRWLEDAGCRIYSSTGARTAINVTAANHDLQRATFFYPGGPQARAALTAEKAPGHLLVCGWPHPPLAWVAKKMTELRARGTFTALDAGPILDQPWTLRALRPVFAALDLFLTNDHELRCITGENTLEAALTGLRREFSGHVVIKRGSRGAIWLPSGRNRPQHFSRRRVRVVNTVGAGDSFNGALLATLSVGVAFPAALRAAGNTAASVVASPRGLLGMRPSRPEIK